MLSAALVALMHLPNFRTLTETSEHNAIASTHAKHTCGEKVSVHVEAIEAGTRLVLKSEPRLWTASMDLGMNFQNSMLVLRSMSETLHFLSIEPASLFVEVLAFRADRPKTSDL